MRFLKSLFIMLRAQHELFIRGELSRTTKLIQNELRLIGCINFVRFNISLFDIVRNLHVFNIFLFDIPKFYQSVGYDP